ncbi:MAG: serpin family protein [Opitutales bacterium]
MKRSTTSPITRIVARMSLVAFATLVALAGSASAKVDAPSTNAFAGSNNAFAVDLYQQLAKENAGKNLFFSPFSVSNALAMTTEGARGETALQMRKVLHFGADMAAVHESLASLNEQLLGEKETAEAKDARVKIKELRAELTGTKKRAEKLRKERKWKAWRNARQSEQELVEALNKELAKVDQYEIRVANALWAEKSYPFKKEYFKTINVHYKTGGIFSVDFRKNFEEVRLRINGWVEEQTKNRIKDLIPSGALNDLTRLVLVNAIYFKGDWSTPFKERDTKDLDFTLAEGAKVKKPTMFARDLKTASYAAFTAAGKYFNTPVRTNRGKKDNFYPGKGGFAMVELPYKGEDLAMVIIAPNDPAQLSAIEKAMTSESLTGWIGRLKKRKTHVYLPKFKVETDYTLGDSEKPGALQKMGMVRAFVDPRNPEGAVFDGMSHATNPQDKLYVTKVLHKAFVEVNEKGTEAAAATAVIMMVPASAPLSVSFTPTFKADRPFIYLIRDRQSGAILFLGRMMEPRASSPN